MTLFQECQNMLKDDFHIINNTDFVLDTLSKYLTQFNSIDWDKVRHKDYDDFNFLLEDISLSDYSIEVFVVADDDDIPIFKSNLELIVSNIYDVIALSPKLFIFNENIILSPLFPTYTIRAGFCD